MSLRHKVGFILCFCLLLTGPFTVVNALAEGIVTPSVWTVEDAVRFALQNNPDSRMGQRRIEAAQAAIAMEKSSFYPQLDLNSHYSQTNNPMYSFGNILNEGEFNQSIDFNNPGRTDDLNVGVRLGYRFFNGGRDLAGLKVAEARKVSSQMEFAAVQSQLAFEVVRAFNLIIQAEGVVKAHQATVEAIGATLEVAKARHEEGVLLKADLLDLEVQHSQAQENLIQAQHGLELARKVFLNVLGIEEGPVSIAPDSAADQEVPQSDDFGQRYELRSMDALIRAAKARVRQANGGYYPSVDGFAGYGVDKGFVLDGSGDWWEAGIKLRFNVFDGKRTAAEVDKSSAMLAEAQEQKRKIFLAISLEVKKAELALKDSEQRLQVTEKTVEQAQESASINRARFAEGVVLSADLISVENRLTDALVRRTSAETARRIAVADLRRALGLPQFPEGEGAPSSETISLNE